MIGLFLNIAKSLKQINELKFVDMEGGNDPQIFPAAFIHIDPIDHKQLNAGSTEADIQFTITAKFAPYIRSNADTPQSQLEELATSLQVIEVIKSKLVKENIEGIEAVMLSRESLQKKGTYYEAPLVFFGRVEWHPD
ncbi:hypothetical protein [Persicobacter sp. CCB-QB2]|uniref:hypothetical protein n=1 Tax=Persicobacter sp. CCB-QB2 TaxID=1561025 RepID=UPI0006A98D13|nr:hypothetical protein [Persicobacter sp. CCB-QB2]